MSSNKTKPSNVEEKIPGKPRIGRLMDGPLQGAVKVAREKPEPSPQSPPAEQRKAKEPKSRRLTKDQLAKEADIQLRENARGLLRKWFSAVDKNLDAGDAKTIEMVGRMFQYDKGPGGVTIFNQHLQVNQAAAAADAARVKSFDQIIAKLEDRDRMAGKNQLALAAVENAESDEDEDIEDAEIIEPEGE